MVLEARLQAELLYSLRAISRHMTWVGERGLRHCKLCKLVARILPSLLFTHMTVLACSHAIMAFQLFSKQSNVEQFCNVALCFPVSVPRWHTNWINNFECLLCFLDKYVSVYAFTFCPSTHYQYCSWCTVLCDKKSCQGFCYDLMICPIFMSLTLRQFLQIIGLKKECSLWFFGEIRYDFTTN